MDDADGWQHSEADLEYAARSLESARKLARFKWRIQQDMRDMETRMAARERGGAEQFVYKQIRQDIVSTETSMEMIVQMCGQQSRAGSGWTDIRLGQEP